MYRAHVWAPSTQKCYILTVINPDLLKGLLSQDIIAVIFFLQLPLLRTMLWWDSRWSCQPRGWPYTDAKVGCWSSYLVTYGGIKTILLNFFQPSQSDSEMILYLFGLKTANTLSAVILTTILNDLCFLCYSTVPKGNFSKTKNDHLDMEP